MPIVIGCQNCHSALIRLEHNEASTVKRYVAPKPDKPDDGANIVYMILDKRALTIKSKTIDLNNYIKPTLKLENKSVIPVSFFQSSNAL